MSNLPKIALEVIESLLQEGEEYIAAEKPEIFNLATHVQSERDCDFIAFSQEDAGLFVHFREKYPQLADMNQVVGWRIILREKQYVIFLDDHRHDAHEILATLQSGISAVYDDPEWIDTTQTIADYAYFLSAETFDQLLAEFSGF